MLAAKSSEMDAAAIPPADVLVCEIVDDMLLGEGVLSTVADARRRLLSPAAQIIPRGGTLYALPVELRVPPRAGFKLDDLNIFNCDQGMTPRAVKCVKLQELPPSEWRALGEAVRLFRFDWATAPIDEVCAPRTHSQRITFQRAGILNAFVLYFKLHCDDDPANDFSSGCAA